MRYDDINKFATDQPLIFHFQWELSPKDHMCVTVAVTIYLVQGQVFEWEFTHTRDGALPHHHRYKACPPRQRRDYMEVQGREYCEEVVNALRLRFPDAIFTGSALPCNALPEVEQEFPAEVTIGDSAPDPLQDRYNIPNGMWDAVRAAICVVGEASIGNSGGQPAWADLHVQAAALLDGYTKEARRHIGRGFRKALSHTNCLPYSRSFDGMPNGRHPGGMTEFMAPIYDMPKSEEGHPLFRQKLVLYTLSGLLNLLYEEEKPGHPLPVSLYEFYETTRYQLDLCVEKSERY